MPSDFIGRLFSLLLKTSVRGENVFAFYSDKPERRGALGRTAETSRIEKAKRFFKRNISYLLSCGKIFVKSLVRMPEKQKISSCAYRSCDGGLNAVLYSERMTVSYH